MVTAPKGEFGGVPLNAEGRKVAMAWDPAKDEAAGDQCKAFGAAGVMREPGRVFTRTELCERVWEHAHDYDTKLVEVFIGRLRKKIGDPPLIHTVRHVGYSIREPEGSPLDDAGEA